MKQHTVLMRLEKFASLLPELKPLRRRPSALFCLMVLSLWGCCGPLASGRAQSLSERGNDENSPNRFGVSARLGFNISAKFRNLGGFSTASSPGPATGGGK